MNRLLQPGDVFRSDRLKALEGKTTRLPTGEPVVDSRNLSPLECGRVTCMWHEEAPGGWKRTTQVEVNTTVELPTARWVVLAARMDGGGTGHGPGDVYPDGWHVLAALSTDASVTLRFYQSGCFRGMVPPEKVELVERASAK